MKSEAFKYFSDQPMTLFALLLFMLIFLGVLFWVNSRSRKNLYQYLSQLPLDGE